MAAFWPATVPPTVMAGPTAQTTAPEVIKSAG